MEEEKQHNHSIDRSRDWDDSIVVGKPKKGRSGKSVTIGKAETAKPKKKPKKKAPMRTLSIRHATNLSESS